MPNSKYSKETKQNTKDIENEQEADESEDSAEEKLKIEKEDKFFKWIEHSLFHGKLDLIENRNVLYFLAFTHFFKSPARTIFAPPPNQ